MIPEVFAEFKRISINPFEIDTLVNAGQDEAVKNCNTCTFRRRKDTGYDAADNDNDQQQGRDGIPDGLRNTDGFVTAGRLDAHFFRINKCNHHTAESHEDTRNISSHEQRGNGYAAGYGRVNDECRGRRNQKSGRCGSNVGCRRVSRIILLLFFQSG